MGQLETITNNLADGYEELVKGTFQEAFEVQSQRRKDTGLRNIFVYTANLPLFRIQDGDLEYGLGGRQTFDAIAGKDIDEFTRQILRNGVYQLTTPQVNQLDDLAADIVWAKAADLGLVRENHEWNYFIIDTSDITADKLSGAQKRLAAKVHGSMEARYYPEQELPDYGETMRMLEKEGKIKQTILWSPTPSHIKKHLQEGEVVARACLLGDFYGDSGFSADVRDVGYDLGLRGVPKVAEGDDAKKLVLVPEDKLHILLTQYVPPVILDQAKKAIADLYQ